MAMNETFLKDSKNSGVYFLPLERHGDLPALASSLQIRLFYTDVGGITKIGDVLQQFGKELTFPSWYGENFDALFDCLTDPEWLQGKQHLLLINGLETLRFSDPDDFATLLEVFAAAAETWQSEGMAFWILIDTPAHGIRKFPSA